MLYSQKYSSPHCFIFVNFVFLLCEVSLTDTIPQKGKKKKVSPLDCVTGLASVQRFFATLFKGLKIGKEIVKFNST